jgi:hypothetical protein
VFTRSGSTWTQQGERLTGTGETGAGEFGNSVALSNDGNTALIGGPLDNGNVGAAWVFTRSGLTWTPQGPKLTATGETGTGNFGAFSVALSADGNTALIGGGSDNGNVGAAWVFTRSGSTWTQQGSKLTATGETGAGAFGAGVALSADAHTALLGAPLDNDKIGAAWVFTAAGGTTTTPGGTTTTPGGGHGGVQSVTSFVRKPLVTHGSEVSFTLRCAHATCHDQATETLTETLKGKRIASISAADHGRGARVVKKTVTVASVTITIAAGATRKVTLKLNATGRTLRARSAGCPSTLLSANARPTAS